MHWKWFNLSKATIVTIAATKEGRNVKSFKREWEKRKEKIRVTGQRIGRRAWDVKTFQSVIWRVRKEKNISDEEKGWINFIDACNGRESS